MSQTALDVAGDDRAVNRLKKKLRREHRDRRPEMPRTGGPAPLAKHVARIVERRECAATSGRES